MPLGKCRPALAAVLLCGGALGGWAQNRTAELRLEVRDPAGLPLDASGELVNQASQVRQSFQVDKTGRHVAKGLPFGVYRLRLEHEGFAPFASLVELRSEVPLAYPVVMGVARIETAVTVTDSETLLDPHRTGSAYTVGRQSLQEEHAAAPGRAAIDLVQAQPGWLLEANGVLHPRGSEYNTQYVIDGVPVLDNRSPAFAAPIETGELQSMTVMTANYPAEYGRKLGGVVELATERDDRPGWHGDASIGAGSFGEREGYLSAHYTRGRITGGLALEGAHTLRFLDPPVEQNYTNRMNSAGAVGHLEIDLTASDRIRAYFHSRRAGFLVPNETVQEQAGQRQDRRNQETMGQIGYQHVISPRALASVHAMLRDLSASLWSNPFSTPMLASQDRGFRQEYFGASLAYNPGAHEFKFGGDGIWTSLRERFSYQITGPTQFDPDVPLQFQFAGAHPGREQALYAQDLWRLGRLTLSAGLRWDHYRLLVSDQAFSPRLGAAWYWPGAGLVLRASYDRAFEFPAIENLLLASSRAAQTLTAETTGLPVPPSRANYYQLGFGKTLLGKFRLDANWFRRDITNFADDDLLLNTGVSFPISFARARIHGYEAKLDLPNWRWFSGYLSYSNLVGTGWLPITGGLFLDAGSAALLHANNSFPITQDQRNTASTRWRFQATSRVWLAAAAHYGSGLPIEIDNPDPAQLAALYSPRILERINLDRGRIRPSFSLDASAGVQLWRHDQATASLQADVLNLSNRLNVINFASLFSGTALAPPRSFALRLQTSW